MRKRFAALLTAAAMAMSLTACGGTNSTAPQAPAETTEAKVSSTDTSTAAGSTDDTGNTFGSASVSEDLGDVWELIDQQEIDFKIGIMSSSVNQSEENYRSASRLQEKYGEDKILLDTFPANAVAEQETTISKVMAMASDPEVKAIVFNQAQDGTIASIKRVKEVRDDILTVACNPNEDYDEVATVADVVLCKDQLGFADQIANMAVSMGAKNFVHYSNFPHQ